MDAVVLLLVALQIVAATLELTASSILHLDSDRVQRCHVLLCRYYRGIIQTLFRLPHHPLRIHMITILLYPATVNSSAHHWQKQKAVLRRPYSRASPNSSSQSAAQLPREVSRSHPVSQMQFLCGVCAVSWALHIILLQK